MKIIRGITRATDEVKQTLVYSEERDDYFVVSTVGNETYIFASDEYGYIEVYIEVWGTRSHSHAEVLKMLKDNKIDVDAFYPLPELPYTMDLGDDEEVELDDEDDEWGDDSYYREDY